MKIARTDDPELWAALEQRYELRALPRLLVEWEHNRFSDVDPVVITPDQAEEPEWHGIYDVDSIVLPNRPGTGIAKSRFHLVRARNIYGLPDSHPNGDPKYVEVLEAAHEYQENHEPRYYLGDEDDPYKYWSSTQRSSYLKNGSNGYDFEDPIVIRVVYPEPVVANKVVVGFETSYSQPDDYDITVVMPGGVERTVNRVPLDDEGRATIWKDRIGSTWDDSFDTFRPFNLGSGINNSVVETTPVYFEDAPKVIEIRVTVRSMRHPAEHLDVIQVGARLEADLSTLVESYDSEFEISDRSLISPLGGASSNTGSVSLSNVQIEGGGLFNNDNDRSPFRGLIGKKAKFTLSLLYDLRPMVDRTAEVTEFTMWVDNWRSGTELQSSAELKDSSIFLQEIPVPQVFWGTGPSRPVNKKTNEVADTPYLMRIGAVIWQLLDIVGFSNHHHDATDLAEGQVIDYYWPEDGDTVWDTISELAKATQTAVYFDEHDVMQIVPRGAIERELQGDLDWTISSEPIGGKLPDIITLKNGEEYVANQIDVAYEPTKFSEFNNGFPKMQTVWEPEEETVMLRSTGLTKDFLASHTSFWINQAEVSFWPFRSMVNINGEILEYEGKEYAYYKPGGVLAYAKVIDQAAKVALDAESDEYLAYQNKYTGRLYVKERGIGTTAAQDHYVRPQNYQTLITNWANSLLTPYSERAGQSYSDGILTIQPPVKMLYTDWIFLVRHPSAIPVQNATYGGRMRFPVTQVRGDNFCCGGLYFAGDSLDGGWYLEVVTTETVERYKRQQNEISLVYIPQTGKAIRVKCDTTNSPKGIKTPITRGTWYDIDIRHIMQPGFSVKIIVYLNGVPSGTWTVPMATRARHANIGHFGTFVRWDNRMDWEYIYGFDLNQPVNQYYQGLLDDPSATPILDHVQGGYISGYAPRDWRYGTYKALNVNPRWHKRKYRVETTNDKTKFVLDEFGPQVHEIREFDVKFDEDDIPAANSYLYLTNVRQVDVLSYRANPFGATFVLANASRQNAIIHGSDDITFGKDNTIDQKLMVYGRSLLQEDEKTLTEKDDDSIRKIGKTVTEFSSRFIQSETAARGLADWTKRMWSQGVDEIEVELFGNPLMQVGDLVGVNYPEKNMLPETHKYYVVNLNNGWDNGLDSRLILRRARA